jgi:hypothetical protein
MTMHIATGGNGTSFDIVGIAWQDRWVRAMTLV